MSAEDQITAAYLKRLHEQMAEVSGILRLFNEEFVHQGSFEDLRSQVLAAQESLRRELTDSVEKKHARLLNQSLLGLSNSLEALQYQQLHLQEELLRLETLLRNAKEEHHASHRRAVDAQKEAISHHVRAQDRDLVRLYNEVAGLREVLRTHDQRISRTYADLDRKIRAVEGKKAEKDEGV